MPMKHEIFHGGHYEIGRGFGQKLRQAGRYILNQLPFAITQERRDFAAACRPVYQQFFPEVLAEIDGLANGQGCSAEDIQAVLFSMYALPPCAPSAPSAHCSCLAQAGLLGRNSDFLTALQEFNMNVIYNFSDNSTGCTDFIGNTTAFIQMEDGVNRRGLALGLTSVAPTLIQPGFNAGLLLRYLLEKCRSVAEVLQACRQLPIASAHTIIAADRQGEIALLEMSARRTEVIRPTEQRPFVYAVNQFSAPGLADCQNNQVDNWRADERRQTLERTLQRQKGRLKQPQVQALLAGENGFICQYDAPATGQDTVWSVVYDLSDDGGIYRAEGNPQRAPFIKDERFSWQ